MSFVEYPDAEMMMMTLADRLVGELRSALGTHDRVSFAVPGGSTPGPLFDVLSSIHLDWERVVVLPTDERWVPPEHERSNARLIRSRLLTDAAAVAAFQPLYLPEAEAEPERALDRLGAQVAELRPLDVVLLGMGADMHIASLFPGADGLAAALDAAAPPLAVMRPETEAEARMTLTGPVLAGALSAHVVITGADKRAAYERALRLDPREAPVQAVLSAGATVHWAP